MHLIEPLGFEISDRYLKRAGLDYWQYLELHTYPNLEDFFEKNRGEYYFFTTKGKKNYTQTTYEGEVYLFFGKETKGLPEELLLQNPDTCVRLPMREGLRSLNLSNTVAVAVYEILRQSNFEHLKTVGELTTLSWDD